MNDRQQGLKNSISSDGVGYYCYLPAAIIYHDFSYRFYYQEGNNIDPFFRPYIHPYKSRGVNKYYGGTAICLLPFFLVGVVISAITGTDMNGYTDTFLMLVSVAAIFYYLLSVFLLLRVGRFFSISDKISFATCLIFLFATNMFHYVIQEPSMSHIYSFFAVSLFLYCYMRLTEQVSTKRLLFLGFALALVALIRPVNVVVVLFTPFFSHNFKEYVLFLKLVFTTHIKGVVLFVFGSFLAVAIQFMFYYLQTGDFYVMTYDGESFDFAHPEILNVLFSYRKGLFVYVPLLLAAFIFILVTKNNRFKKTVFFITFSVFMYITASWYCWWYGGGFGLRPVIDVLPLFIIVCMLLYSKLQTKAKRIILISTLPFLFLCQLMAFQYSNKLMDGNNMTEDKFWDIFLKTDLAKINEGRMRKILERNEIQKTELLNYENDGDDPRVTNSGYHSNKACIVGEKNHFSKAFEFSVNSLRIKGPFYIIMECMVKTNKEGKDLGLILWIDERNNLVVWDEVFRSQFNEGIDGWVKMTHVVEVDGKFNNDISNIKIFAHTEKGDNLVDDLKYTIVKK
ncbi:MAG: hypothetical protein V4677_04575 [Bacteroidota bacterium]